MTDKEYLEQKYYLHIIELKRHSVWTLDQIKKYLHLDFSTIQAFVSQRILFKFNVSKCTFYSTKKVMFTNQAIIKSILEIDAFYSLKYYSIDKFEFDSNIESKSLISRNVSKIGYCNIPEKPIYYNVYVLNSLTKKEYEKIAKILIDIQLNNFDSDYNVVSIICHDLEDLVELKDYLDNHPKLLLLLNYNKIAYQVIEFNHSHYKYLKI